MRTYLIYWMKEEILNSHFGKEVLIMQLLNELKDIENQDLVKKQIQFITKCMPQTTLQNFLKSILVNERVMRFDPDSFTIYLDDDSFAQLVFSKDCLTIHACGNREVEILWFEYLRRFAPTFFAYETKGRVCGWLSPIKQSKKYV